MTILLYIVGYINNEGIITDTEDCPADISTAISLANEHHNNSGKLKRFVVLKHIVCYDTATQ